MSDSSYEIELKSLLGSRAAAQDLKEKMKTRDPSCGLLRREQQRNHYFVKGDINVLAENTTPLLGGEKSEELETLASHARDFSVRTRDADGRVLLVVKASVDDTTSENGITRLEFEAEVPELSLEELDKVVLDSGFEYQAKWSREREEYEYKNVTVCLDKNAGYGYLAEFEVVETDASRADETKEQLRALMRELGAEELPQARLERMFTYYNEHWPEYYGTENTFVVE